MKVSKMRSRKPAEEETETLKTEEVKVFLEFPSYSTISHGDLLGLSLSTNTTSYTHGLHRFPAKYIPQVPRWAIREFATAESIVLDPFMGSGTTLVEGICHGLNVYGIDIDPLAQLIARAKTHNYDKLRLERLLLQVFAAEDSAVPVVFLPMKGVKNIEHWFPSETWMDLCVLYSAIEALECTDQERDFFRCLFSSILRWVSNADNQTQKTYVSGTLKKLPPPCWPTFKRVALKAISSVAELDCVPAKGRAEIFAGSALEMPLADASVDLIVTSPPYLDSVDYMYNFMLEYFWLGPNLGVDSRTDFNRLRKAPIGAKQPHGGTPSALPRPISDLVPLTEIPPYRLSAICSYFNSMWAHFQEAARVLREDGRYVLVVGNSQVEAGVIPVHQCLLRLAKDAGLHLEKAFAYRIRRHYMKFPRKGRGGIILMDWVITFRKTNHSLIPVEDRLPIPNITIGHDEVAH